MMELSTSHQENQTNSPANHNTSVHVTACWYNHGIEKFKEPMCHQGTF